MPIELAILGAGLNLRRRGEDEFHGYAVAKQIGEQEEARRLTAHGTLYRALERLEQRKLLESRLEDPEIASSERRPRRRLYTLTAVGVAAAQAAARPPTAALPRQNPGAAAL
ncbi:MAG: helix-turn-helix transcriptional regulator [Chloroflexi bacterium]|nr:helix-turn-helix transcriptional regulator [Chloroflexota bacterium]